MSRGTYPWCDLTAPRFVLCNGVTTPAARGTVSRTPPIYPHASLTVRQGSAILPRPPSHWRLPLTPRTGMLHGQRRRHCGTRPQTLGSTGRPVQAAHRRLANEYSLGLLTSLHVASHRPVRRPNGKVDIPRQHNVLCILRPAKRPPLHYCPAIAAYGDEHGAKEWPNRAVFCVNPTSYTPHESRSRSYR